jgi:8-amino-7-oxononanoate synthase
MPEPEDRRASAGLQSRIEGDLDRLREQSQLRTLEIPDGINLCSNDYLGLAVDSRLKRAVIEAVAHAESVGSTGSRLLSGNSREWEELESDFARFAGTEAALYFGSGYAANIGLLGSIVKHGDIVFSDALNHASLIDGIRLSNAFKVKYPHGDMDFLENALRKHAGSLGARAIVTESVFSMEGDVAPIERLLRMAHDYSAELVIDEAHATGVWGPQGKGIAAELNCQREVLAIIHTCGKALASAGAFVCGRGTLRKYLVNHARTFIFSTATPPYLAGQIRAALDLAIGADTERVHLRRIASSLREGIADAGLECGASTTQIVPVYLGSNETALLVASQLREQGFAVRAIRPPTVPVGTSRLRLSLTARITANEIERLVRAITAATKSLQQVPSASTAHG